MATATFTTVVDRAIGDPITEAIWDDQLKDNVNQLGGAHRNLLTNGGFEVWQRGAGAFTAHNAYTADRWIIDLGASGAVSITREATTIDSSGTYALACANTTTNANYVRQKIEDYGALRGRTLSFSARVRQSVASGVSISIQDNVSGTTSAFSATTGSYVTLTTTYTLNAAATQCILSFTFVATGTYYLDNAMLVIGPAPAPYQPLHPQEDLARCQRYYEVLGGVTDSVVMRCYQAAAAGISMTVFFKVTKGGTPTVTKNGTWAVTNCGQPGVGGASVGSCYLTATATATADTFFSPNSSDDTLTVEFNP